MNWQIMIGALSLIGGIGTLALDPGFFLIGSVLGIPLLLWGMRRKGLFTKRVQFRSSAKSSSPKEKIFHASGVSFYEDNIRSLAYPNPDWALSASEIAKNRMEDSRIFRFRYVSTPVELVPEGNPSQAQGSLSILIAGKTVGYLSSADEQRIRKLQNGKDAPSLTATVSGGAYKIVGSNGNVTKGEAGFRVDLTVNNR